MYLSGVTFFLLVVRAFITCRLRLHYAVKLDSAVHLTHHLANVMPYHRHERKKTLWQLFLTAPNCATQLSVGLHTKRLHQHASHLYENDVDS